MWLHLLTPLLPRHYEKTQQCFGPKNKLRKGGTTGVAGESAHSWAAAPAAQWLPTVLSGLYCCYTRFDACLLVFAKRRGPAWQQQESSFPGRPCPPPGQAGGRAGRPPAARVARDSAGAAAGQQPHTSTGAGHVPQLHGTAAGSAAGGQRCRAPGSSRGGWASHCCCRRRCCCCCHWGECRWGRWCSGPACRHRGCRACRCGAARCEHVGSHTASPQPVAVCPWGCFSVGASGSSGGASSSGSAASSSASSGGCSSIGSSGTRWRQAQVHPVLPARDVPRGAPGLYLQQPIRQEVRPPGLPVSATSTAGRPTGQRCVGDMCLACLQHGKPLNT